MPDTACKWRVRRADMTHFNALWVDSRLGLLPQTLPAELDAACHLTVVSRDAELPVLVQQTRPGLIVFDFDYPDAAGLREVLRMRQQFAHIPVLMLIDSCYDSLLLWALRARVWDVLIKPVVASSLLQRMNWIRQAPLANASNGQRSNAMPGPPVPMEARFAADGGSIRTGSVCSYVKAHLTERLSETALASRFGMSRWQFSRAFHKEHGITFRKYLLAARLHRATVMLSRTDAPITEVAGCAGFNDLSHFANLFRRHEGCSPSEYRQRLRAQL